MPELTPQQTDIVRRIAVTMLALAAYRALSIVPLPGISLAGTANLDPSTMHRLSIAALGLAAWMPAVMLAEIAVLVLPDTWTKRLSRFGHAAPFAALIVALALAFSVLQGAGIAVALEQSRNLVDEPGALFKLTTIATLAGGTALTIVLARIIETAGIGSGFWVLLAASSATELASGAVRAATRALSGIAGQNEILIPVATVIAVLAIVALILTRARAGFLAGEPVVWPIAIYGFVLTNLVLPLGLLIDRDFFNQAEKLAVFMPDHPIGLAIAALLLALITYRYARNESSIPLWPATLAVLFGTLLLSALANLFVATYALYPGKLVVATAVAAMIALSIQQRWNAPSAG